MLRVMVAVQFSSDAQLCSTLCDPMGCSMPGFPVYHQFPEPTQTHAHWGHDAIQPSHPLSSPWPPAFSLSQHQGLSQWVSFSHQVAKVLEFVCIEVKILNSPEGMHVYVYNSRFVWNSDICTNIIMFIFKSGLLLKKWQKMVYYICIQATNSKQFPKGTPNTPFLISIEHVWKRSHLKSKNTIE